MKPKSVKVYLMGGLGNQMFDYAVGRALALRNDARLYVDARSGFVRDKVFKRTFELGSMNISARAAGGGGGVRRSMFWLLRIRERLLGTYLLPVDSYSWLGFVRETPTHFLEEVYRYNAFSSCWMYGYWQCERYFEDARGEIANDLAPPAPPDPLFRAMAKKMAACNSVAVGVRLFEEVLGANKEGVGGLTPMSFDNTSVLEIAARVSNPVFFVFCTVQSPQLSEIQFPGEVHFVTHDNGFNGAIPRLWLISQCAHHVLSNSTFYWWGAWLAEHRQPGAHIIASDLYPNHDTVPERWRGR